MDEIKKEMKDIIKNIDKMHKKDPEFITDKSRKTKKKAERILFHIERGTPEIFIHAMVNKLEE